METPNIFAVIGSILFAISGACAKWISVAEKRQQATLLEEIGVATFIGGMTFAVFTSQSWDMYLMFTASGFLGWVGASSIDLLGRWVMKKLGIGLPKGKDDESDGE